MGEKFTSQRTVNISENQDHHLRKSTVNHTFDMQLYECKVEPQNMPINVKINGKLEKAIVDTAAQTSVINKQKASKPVDATLTHWQQLVES